MRRLDEDEIDDMLVRQGIGVLAVADGPQPYAIPMSFGYDAEKPVFPMQWGGGSDSRKDRAIESNPNVCLTVYEQAADDASIWRSIVITGEIYEIPAAEEQHALVAIASNAEFPPDLGVWGIPFEDVEFRLFGLAETACTGREFSTAYEDWDVDQSG